MIAMAADCDATVFGELSFNVPTLGALYQDATWRLINERRWAIARAGVGIAGWDALATPLDTVYEMNVGSIR
jgi:hypothetical protein